MNHRPARPVLLDLNPLNLRLPALVSILHRLSGIFIFFLIPAMLWMLQESLYSEQNFEELKIFFDDTGLFLLFWLALSALGFHLLAGIRHMLMDMHIGESLRGGRMGAVLVIITSIVLAISLMLIL